jgi:hypothetical protein
MLNVREDIHELSNDELASSLEELAVDLADEENALRTAESLTEAAKRLRDGRSK